VTDLTQERLMHLLHYDPLTGEFTWMVSQGRVLRGQPAGCLRDDGYLRIRVDGQEYMAHRLAIFYMTGAFPPDDADHKNRVRLANHWENLRPATRAQNCANRSVTAANTSGVVGVHWDRPRKKWCARIKVFGKTKMLGRFESLEDATRVRKAAEAKHFGDFAPRHGAT
jgi:hypothetical protein